MRCVTVAGAAGGPVFGALLDRSRRPDRALAGPLASRSATACLLAAAMTELCAAAAYLLAGTGREERAAASGSAASTETVRRTTDRPG